MTKSLSVLKQAYRSFCFIVSIRWKVGGDRCLIMDGNG